MNSLLPLDGRRIIVTRGTQKADRLPALLEEAGATVVHVPLLATAPVASAAGLRAALERLRQGGPSAARPWLVLTSETAAGLLFDAVGPDGLDGLALAVVGPATAAALEAGGARADVVAPGQVAESLAAELVAHGVAGSSVLLVAAEGGRQVIAPALVRAGAAVEVIHAYRSVMPPGAADRLRDALLAPPPHAITFTSGSTVRHCAAALRGTEPPPIAAVCIGPVTARSARDAGWVNVVTAAEHTAAGVVAAAVTCLAAVQPLP
jgi:uroporphyrinogen-III synthase